MIERKKAEEKEMYVLMYAILEANSQNVRRRRRERERKMED